MRGALVGLAGLVTALGGGGCGFAVTAGASMARTAGAQTVTFNGELDEGPGTATDVEVSSRSDNYDLYGLLRAGPAELLLGYGVQLADVRSRDAMTAPGVPAAVGGDASFSDRVIVGVDVPLVRQKGLVVRPYALAGFTAIAGMLGFGARPMRSYEGGLEIDLENQAGLGMALRVGFVLERGYTERAGVDEFGFADTQRGEYDARGLVVTVGFRVGDITEGFR